jgi:hypothetical protein
MVAYLVSNTLIGLRLLNVAPDDSTATVISVFDVSRSKSSRPFRAHAGCVPPAADTFQNPLFTCGNGRTWISARPDALDSYAM